MKTMLKQIDDHGTFYEALMFSCPGCSDTGITGLHLLPINSATHSPSWDWDGNLESPTLSPSILTRTPPYVEGKPSGICHSYLRNGVFEFLPDSTHSLAGQQVPVPDLPEWAVG